MSRLIAMMDRWSGAAERSAARIRARTALRSRIMDEVSHEIAATIQPGEDRRLLLRVVDAEFNRRYRRALKAENLKPEGGETP